MKRFIAILLIICASIFLSSTVLATASPYMTRKSDTIDESALYDVQSSAASSTETESAKDKAFNLFAWFEPDDSANVRADSAIVSDAETRIAVGAPNSGQFLEAIKIYSRSSRLAVMYSTRLDGEDYSQEARGLYNSAEISGNMTGESKKINNLKIRLDGSAALTNNIYYRVFASGIGWLDWAANGAPAVADDVEARIESLEIRILPLTTPPPPKTTDLSNVPLLTLRAHQAYTGWTVPVMGKDVSVDSEEDPRRIEAIAIGTNNPNLRVNYQALVAGIGWTGLVDNDVEVGSIGQSRALEALKIILSGEGADQYDLYYRVKVENYGWLDWANNGQMAGTANQGLAIEAIQIKILPMGSSVPGNSELPGITAIEREEGEVLKHVNTIRIQKGLRLLTGDEKLHQAAQKRAEETYISFSHIRPSQLGYESVLDEIGYRNDSVKPALGETMIKSADSARVCRTLDNKQTSVRMMLTDYYQYFAYAYHGGAAQNSVALFSDTISSN